MIRVIILFAPENKIFKEVVSQIRQALHKKKFDCMVKTAVQAMIPDLTAADCIIFGTGDQEKGNIHPDFAEIARALSGINLAGRIAALFALDSENTILKWKKILKDSGITIYKEPLILKQKTGLKQVNAWITGLLSALREKIHE